MRELNATWPHAGHRFLNMGQAAVTLDGLVNHHCDAQFLPRRPVDLVLVEQHEEDADQNGLLIESLLWRIRHSFPRRDRGAHIPVIFVSTRFVIPFRPEYSTQDVCVRDGTLCASTCARNFTKHMLYKSAPHKGRDNHTAVINAHGASELSLADMFASALRDGVPAALGCSVCELAANLYADSIHPSATGKLYLADALVDHLERAVMARRSFQNKKLHTTRWPVRRATARPHRSCYLTEHLPVVSTTGFQYTATETVRGVAVNKDGWVGMNAGDHLRLRVDTAEEHECQRSNVSITYLRSYEHMGEADVSCAAGCSCASTRVNAHVAAERVSVHEYLTLQVSRSSACEIEVRISEDTTSGEYKFKIIGVAVECQG